MFAGITMKRPPLKRKLYDAEHVYNTVPARRTWKYGKQLYSLEARELAKDRLFAKHYCSTLSATKAFMETFGTDKRTEAEAVAYKLMHKPTVIKFIQQEFDRRARKIDVKAEDIIRYWLNLATADTRELTPIVCCRYCYGIDFQYQYTLNEYRTERQRHLMKQLRLPEHKRVEFDEQGGSGYDFTKDPNPNCPECHGRGEFNIRGLDLKNMSEQALSLFEGIKYSGRGYEVLRRDRSYAMTMLQRLLGYEVEKKVVYLKKFDPGQLSDEELVKELANLQEYIETDFEEVESK